MCDKSALWDEAEEIRNSNMERESRYCLYCGRSFITTRNIRICGQCHKIVDRL